MFCRGRIPAPLPADLILHRLTGIHRMRYRLAVLIKQWPAILVKRLLPNVLARRRVDHWWRRVNHAGPGEQIRRTRSDENRSNPAAATMTAAVVTTPAIGERGTCANSYQQQYCQSYLDYLHDVLLGQVIVAQMYQMMYRLSKNS